jgi:hypothetical protein
MGAVILANGLAGAELDEEERDRGAHHFGYGAVDRDGDHRLKRAIDAGQGVEVRVEGVQQVAGVVLDEQVAAVRTKAPEASVRVGGGKGVTPRGRLRVVPWD